MVRVRSIKDIAAIESGGYDSYLPDKTPYDLIRRACDRDLGAIALRYVCEAGSPQKDRVYTYDDLVRRIHQTARAFRRLGQR